MATVREIAAEAGVSPRVVQYDFTDKDDVLVTVQRLLHRENGRQAPTMPRASPIPCWRRSSCTTRVRWRIWSPP